MSAELQVISGDLVSFTRSGKSENCYHIRLSTQPGKTFTLYREHPSFRDFFDYKKDTPIDLVIYGRVVRDFYSDSDNTILLRNFLTQFGIFTGSSIDRKRLKILYTKLTSSFNGKSPTEVLGTYPYYAMSVPKHNRLYDFDAADRMCDQLGFSARKRCRGHCHYKIKDICEDGGHTCIPYNIYANAIIGFPQALIHEQLENLINHGSLICRHDKDELKLFTSSTYSRESTIRDFLKYDHEPLPLEFNGLSIPEITDEQALVLDLVAERRVAVLSGGAGCGKTRCIAALTCAYKNVVLAAPTGKAARRIVQSCQEYNPQITASTIHSLLGINGDSKTNVSKNISRNSLLVLDEASMIDMDVMFEIVRAVKERNLGLLLVGDPNQLPAVSRGDIFSNIIDWARTKDCIVELSEIQRQAESNPICQIGKRICTNSDQDIFELFDNSRVQFHETFSYMEAIEKAIALREIYSNNVFDAQIISPWRNVCASVNKQVIGEDRRITSFQSFDFVMCTSNVTSQEAENLPKTIVFPKPTDKFILRHIQQGKNPLTDTHDGNMKILVHDEIRKGVNGHSGILLTQNILIDENSELVYIGDEKSHAACVTIHKSQGSEWPTIILILYGKISSFINKRLLYTAITRAKERLIVVGRPELLQLGIEQDAKKRHSLSYT